ncbi:MAG TPA: hypothetical protein PLI51_00060 [bacterium]|nr:hypothetical protein [bacterium]HPQ65104.1 hypothetical protein [bacterium]
MPFADNLPRTAARGQPLPPCRVSFPAAALLLLAALVVYYPCLGGGFFLDDGIHIAGPAGPIRSPGWPELLDRPFFTIPGTGAGQYYRPAALAAYKLILGAAGDNPVPFHLVNVVLHAAAGALVASLAARWLGSAPGGLAAGLFFLVHPLQAEEVAYISGMGGLLAALGMLLSLRLLLGAAGKGTVAVSTGVYACALLSKESALLFPVWAALLIWAETPGMCGLKRLRLLLPHCLAAGLYLALRAWFLPGIAFLGSAGGPGPAAGIPASARGLLESARLVLLPGGLHLFRSLPLKGAPAAAAAGAALAAGGAVLYASRLARPRDLPFWPAAGAVWFLAAMAPFAGIKPLLLQPGVVFWGEHFHYLALGGAALLFAGAFRAAARCARVSARLGAGTILVLLAVLSQRQAALWGAPPLLAAGAAAAEPRLFRTRAVLADVLSSRGRYAEAVEEYAAARENLRRSANPVSESGYAPLERKLLYGYLLGSCYAQGRQGHYLEAARSAAAAWGLFPEDSLAASYFFSALAEAWKSGVLGKSRYPGDFSDLKTIWKNFSGRPSPPPA